MVRVKFFVAVLLTASLLAALGMYELPRLGVASAHIGPTSVFHPYDKDRRSANPIVQGAIAQLEHPSAYTTGYFKIPYPNGDIPADQGVCTDVVIRALRHAGHDLQKLIHEDMRANFKKYPRREPAPDANIDHRRVPNQMYFFKTHGLTLTNEVSKSTVQDWQPGDLVYWKLDSGLDHTGVISDRKNPGGIPLVIHNISQTAEQDVLTTWKIVGHYRYPLGGEVGPRKERHNRPYRGNNILSSPPANIRTLSVLPRNRNPMKSSVRWMTALEWRGG